MTDLSIQAKKELRQILIKEIGIESVTMLNEIDLNKLGLLFISIFSESLKMKKGQESI
ncbi:MAG: hypothetical protein WA101_00300 [Minisyncoccia bacterium]